MHKSTSLVAGVCTVCIATATGAAQPPVASHESAMRVVSQEVALTATGNRLADIAALPFQNYFTIASTLGQLAAFVPPVNAATGAFLQGNFAPIPALLQKAFIDEMNAIAAVIQLPGTIIAHDLDVILGAPAAAANNMLATHATAGSAVASTGNSWVDVAALPFQNYFTIASTLGQLAAFVAPVNAATGAFFQGNWAPIPGLLTKAFNDELAAINNVLKLPGEVISYDLGVISRALGSVHPTGLNAGMSSIERDALAATLASFADKDAPTNKDVVDGEVVSVHTTIGGPADVDPPAIDPSDADKKDADKKDADKTGEKDAPTTGADTTEPDTNDGKKFADAIGKKFAELTGKKDAATNGKKDAEATGKNDSAMTGKKDNDAVGAIRHAISNATGKKKADNDSAAK